jgi:hypothetical protein
MHALETLYIFQIQRPANNPSLAASPDNLRQADFNTLLQQHVFRLIKLAHI